MSFIIYHTLIMQMDCIVLAVCFFTQKHSGNSHRVLRVLFKSHIGIGKTLGLILGATV